MSDRLPDGYRYPVAEVHALCELILSRLDDETLYGCDPVVHHRLAGGYVLRDDPRDLAQALLDAGYRKP